MLRSVWKFFDYQFCCWTIANDGMPSTYNIALSDFRTSRKRGDLSPVITLRETDRKEEAFVHELLHLELARRGYPRFGLSEMTAQSKRHLARVIRNAADHTVMLPIFKTLGYSEEEFLGPSPAPTPEIATVLRDFRELDPAIAPDSFEAFVSAYLRRHEIYFDAIIV